MARNVLDTAMLLQVMAGRDFIDGRQTGAPAPKNVPAYGQLVIDGRREGIRGCSIGILKEGFEHPSMSLEVESVVRKATRRFESLGALVEEVSVPT